MKKSIILGLLLLPIFIFGQSKVTVFSPHVFQTPSVVLNPPFFNLKNYTFQFRSVKITEPDFTIYNKTSQLNDLFCTKKDTIYYQKSIFITENHLYGIKTDSFNPGGAPDLGSALLLGLLNTVFGKIQLY